MSRDPPPHLFPIPPIASSSSTSAFNPTGLPSFPADRPGSVDPTDFTSEMVIPDDEEGGDEENIFRDMTFDEILEDLNARFLVNLPREEMSLVRVYWQAEQAHWFYEDYLRPLNPLLPSLSQRQFTHLIIASSPLYSHLGSDDYDAVWEEYCRYKRMVPCCGGILVNQEGDKCLMVRGWKSNAGWCFPRGKINSEEAEVACAIREVEEETGFNLSGLINPDDRIQTQISAQVVTMFIVGGIDENTVFETQTKKEIGAIEWVPFLDLPTWQGKRGPKTTTQKGKKKFYNVTPFVGPLKRWLTVNGYPVFPKRRPAAPASHTTAAAFRQLEPYNFDGSPAASPQTQIARPSPPFPHDHTALDNLFHRFVHKQTEDLDAPANDNKAGLERLFGNLNVLKKEDEAGYEAEAREKQEDDALARLLGGLTTGTPAPRPRDLEPPRTEKASKFLAMLNNVPSSASPTSKAPSVKPHQASLLAVLSPQLRSGTANSSSSADTALPNHPYKPMSLPTSPKPPSPTQEERAKKQRALLEQITAGFGLDIPVVHPSPQQGRQLPLQEAVPQVYGSRQAQPTVQRISPQQHHVSPPPQQPPHAYGGPASGPPAQRTSHGYPAQRISPPTHIQNSPNATRNPPPPYEPPQASYPHLVPSQSQPHPHPPVQVQTSPHAQHIPTAIMSQYSGGQQGQSQAPADRSDQHRALLSVLQHQQTQQGQLSQPPVSGRPGGLQAGYRPASQPYSGGNGGNGVTAYGAHHPLPPLPLPGGFGPTFPGPPSHSQPQPQPSLPPHVNSYRPHSSFPAPGYTGPGNQQPSYPQFGLGGPPLALPQPGIAQQTQPGGAGHFQPTPYNHQHGHHSQQPPPSFMHIPQQQVPPQQQPRRSSQGAGSQNQVTGYHHPVPRPPSGNAGTLLGMLNDGR